jgi:hypothetical protein
VSCISAFSEDKKLSKQDSFNYLYENKGIDFLIDCYEAEHTLSFNDAVHDLTIVTGNNGGSVI